MMLVAEKWGIHRRSAAGFDQDRPNICILGIVITLTIAT